MESKITSDFVNYVTENKLPLVVHWDGKLLKNTTDGPESVVDRLPIVVSGGGTFKILEIPKLKSGINLIFMSGIVIKH